MNKRVENANTAKQLLLEWLSERGNDWFDFNASNYAKDLGAHPTTVQRHIHSLVSDGLIQIRHPHGRSGGYEVMVIKCGERHADNGERHDDNSERHTQDTERHDEKPLRKCRRCGTMAANEKARFCWKCGETLLTEKELLKEEFNMTLGRICRFINDSREVQRITDTLDKVGKLAFKED